MLTLFVMLAEWQMTHLSEGILVVTQHVPAYALVTVLTIINIKFMIRELLTKLSSATQRTTGNQGVPRTGEVVFPWEEHTNCLSSNK